MPQLMTYFEDIKKFILIQDIDNVSLRKGEVTLAAISIYLITTSLNEVVIRK